jgi:hypothetical protein
MPAHDLRKGCLIAMVGKEVQEFRVRGPASIAQLMQRANDFGQASFGHANLLPKHCTLDAIAYTFWTIAASFSPSTAGLDFGEGRRRLQASARRTDARTAIAGNILERRRRRAHGDAVSAH